MLIQEDLSFIHNDSTIPDRITVVARIATEGANCNVVNFGKSTININNL